MSATMSRDVPQATADAQRRAADPGASVWVSANAGAGKTKVLVDRVVRLLLDGTAPARILCLTFTKAAAAEMTIRVFKELGEWVTLDDVGLKDRLEKLTGVRPRTAGLAPARRLFAQAVEAPGGLKIETIHAFCERILHLVPFEAGVPPRFAVLDESQTAELMGEARARVLSRASGSRELAAAVERVGSLVFGDALAALVDEAASDPRVPGDADGRECALLALARALGLRPADTADAIRRAMVTDGIPPSDWAGLADAFRATRKAADLKRAASLEAALAATDDEARLAAYLPLFVKADGKPRREPDLGTAAIPPGLRDRLAAERERLVALRDRLYAAETLERTDALYRLAGAVRAEAEAAKVRLGALDFADLIARTVDLLDRDFGAWVLYKLDRGIDHVLVDEAQDTNPDQWRILRRLTEEFTAGAGRPGRRVRTVFAVGDPKQSIYSFQGAEPREFEEGRQHWRRQAAGARLRFEDVRLDLSFRSAPAVLRAVDATFAIAAHYQGLTFGDEVRTSHSPARIAARGAVEIWPTELPKAGDADPDAWTAPVDAPDQEAPAVVTARRVAAAVRRWTTTGDETGRVWRAGDVTILSRKRGAAFFAVIRALKAAGIGVAGADRLDIGEHIAVADLVAAGGAALLPANDLALAAALKSPLVGLDDNDLVRIAADRGPDETLADALARCAATGDAAAARGDAALAGWRDLAGRHGPFGFYAALLGPGGGRRRLIERLGHEAADAVDSFLGYAQALEFGPEAGTLTGFLARFEGASHTIKRDLEASADEVRVMTVHGAKGLEAPLVVLLDGCEIHGPERPLVAVPVGGNGEPLPVWSAGAAGDPVAVAAAKADRKAKALEEHNRLLYVAMTRARDRLVVAPYAGVRGEPEGAWCGMIRRGFAEATHALTVTEHDFPYGPASVWTDGAAAGVAAPASGLSAAAAATAPDWLFRSIPPEPEPLPPLRPSGALGAAERADDRPPDETRDDAARRRGVLVHALIDHLGALPVAERPGAAHRFLQVRAAGLASTERDGIAAAAEGVVAHPDLRPLFGPDGRGEVPIAGTLAGRPVSAQVDRLAVTPDAVLVADFKSGARPRGTSIPERYLAQLALYRALMADIHPGRTVRALLVWTDRPTVVEPSADALDAALAAVLSGA